MAIVITGSVAYDYLMTFPGYFRENILPDKLDKISLSFLVDTMTRQRGGVAPNIAYTLALLGEKPMVFATAGEDFEGPGAEAVDRRHLPDERAVLRFGGLWARCSADAERTRHAREGAARAAGPVHERQDRASLSAAGP